MEAFGFKGLGSSVGSRVEGSGFRGLRFRVEGFRSLGVWV